MRFAMMGVFAAMTISCTSADQLAQAPAQLSLPAGHPSATNQGPLPAIEHRVTSWGRTVSHSALSPNGWLVREKLDFNSGEVTQSTRQKLTRTAHLAAIAALDPLRVETNRNIGCSNAPTDGPSGVFTWDSANRLDIYYPCSRQHPKLSEAENAYWGILDDAASFEVTAGG